MPRKGSSGPPEGRSEEESIEPSESEDPLAGALDAAVELEREEGDEIRFIYGDVVQDREDEDPTKLVAVNTPDEHADEWEIDGETTLAEMNPKYPERDDVVIVVPKDDLDEYDEDWDEREEEYELDTLREDAVDYEPYPSRRLILIEESHLRE